MAKMLIKNRLGSKKHTFNLPCDDTVASAFCAEMLDGEYVGYAQTTVTGTPVASPYIMASVMIQNDAGLKAYLNLAVKSSKSEADIHAALAGKTFNGVKTDNSFVLKMQSVA